MEKLGRIALMTLVVLVAMATITVQQGSWGSRNNNNDNNNENGDGYGNGGLQWLPQPACRHGTTTYDLCNQKCKCLHGFPAQCTRVRKEFSSMTIEERRRYIQTIRTASTDRVYKAEYDRLIATHRRLFSTAIHRKDHFLPWHRWYLLRYENLMRQIDCRFTVAYWDWGKDSRQPWRQLTRDVWYTGTTGLGGNGAERGRCVRTGPFRAGRWRLTPSARNRCLARQFTGTPPDTVAIMELLRTSANNFHEFELALRVLFHDQVHCQIGRTMCSRNSANAPEFFLHHAMVDRIWDDWQKKSSTHRNAFFTSVRGNMPGTRHRPSSFLTMDRHPSWVRVEYATPSGQEDTLTRFRGMTFKQLQKVPNRPRMSALSRSALRLFQVSTAEAGEARRLQAKFLPK